MVTKKDPVWRNTLKGFGMACVLGMAVACGGGEAPKEGGAAAPEAPAKAATPLPGMVTAQDITLGALDQAMAEHGKQIAEVKCMSCHSWGSNRIVGPGWENILKQRTPEWIMNMILHTDAMLETDPEAQAMLEECLVRMPNQNLSQAEARDVLEFMRTLEK